MKKTEKIYFKKYITNEVDMEAEVNTQEFFAKFYNSSNQVIYFWGIVDDYITTYEIWNNSLTIKKDEKITWWRDSLRLDITRWHREYKFELEISKEEFFEKVIIYLHYKEKYETKTFRTSRNTQTKAWD